MRGQPDLPAAHSPAWVVQSWLSFVIAVTALPWVSIASPMVGG
jgi:hypothetical protein